MTQVVTVKVEGLAKLNAALARMSAAVATKIVRKATTASAAVVRDQVKADAPTYTGPIAQGHPPAGTLKRAIAIRRSKKYSTRTKAVAEVFVRHWGRTGKTKGQRAKGVAAYSKYDAYYWHMVEFGTSKMTARKFMRNGFKSSEGRAYTTMVDTILRGIEDEARNK